MTVYYHRGDFPPESLNWMDLIPLLGPASGAVARYDGTLSAIPNASLLLSPLTTQEALLSSRIEGTQATMGEVLEYEVGGGLRWPNLRAQLDIESSRDILLALLTPSKRQIEHLKGNDAWVGEARELPNMAIPDRTVITTTA